MNLTVPGVFCPNCAERLEWVAVSTGQAFCPSCDFQADRDGLLLLAQLQIADALTNIDMALHGDTQGHETHVIVHQADE